DGSRLSLRGARCDTGRWVGTGVLDEARVTEVLESVPPLARGPVLAIAGGLGVLLLVTSGRYGSFGDELYFLAAGRRLDWGYADQPPLLPLLARAMDTAFPGSLAELRLPVVPLAVLGVVVGALLA